MAGKLTQINFASGVVKDDTPLAAEGGWIDADKVRFWLGRPQSIGGWVAASTDTFVGRMQRALFAWTDLAGTSHVAMGSDGKAEVFTGTSIVDITPNFNEGTVGPFTNVQVQTTDYSVLPTDEGALFDFSGGGQLTISTLGTGAGELPPGMTFSAKNSTTSARNVDPPGNGSLNGKLNTVFVMQPLRAYSFYVGVDDVTITETYIDAFTTTNGSSTVTVNIPEHGGGAGGSLTISNAPTVAGINPNGTWTIASVPTRNTLTFTAGSNATSTTTGGSADFVIAWQSVASSNWSLDAFGEMLLLNRRGGPIYGWQPATSYADRAINGNFALTTGWGLGTGWTITGGVAQKTAGTDSNLSQNIENVFKAGQVIRVIFTVTRTAGSLKLRINGGTGAPVPIDVGAASTPITQSGTYSRLVVLPAGTRDILFNGSSTFAGTIDNVSYQLESKAWIISEAPRHVDVMWVDPNQLVCAAGTYEVDGDYNPTLIRNSDRGNMRVWVPDDDNLAQEEPLNRGGKVVGVTVTREQTLIHTDAALFAMQFGAEGFSYRPKGSGGGLISLHGSAENNGFCFWLTRDRNCYSYTGSIPQIVDHRLLQDMFDNLAVGYEDRVYCGINGAFNEVWWFYPDARDGTNECSRYVAFNYKENHWTCGVLARTAWINGGVTRTPMACGTDGKLYKHETGDTADGIRFTNRARTGRFDIEDGHNLMQIMRFVPNFKRQGGPVNITLTFYSRPNATGIVAGPYVAQTTTKQLDFRKTGRQCEIEFDSQYFWRLGVPEMETAKSGAIR